MQPRSHEEVVRLCAGLEAFLGGRVIGQEDAVAESRSVRLWLW